jgi:hypothetical protein
MSCAKVGRGGSSLQKKFTIHSRRKRFCDGPSAHTQLDAFVRRVHAQRRAKVLLGFGKAVGRQQLLRQQGAEERVFGGGADGLAQAMQAALVSAHPSVLGKWRG